MTPPYNDDNVQELLRCDDAIQAMYCDGDILYTGDEKGVVTNWDNDKMLFKFNLVEEVKSLAVEKKLIFTVRDLDVVVSEVVSGKSGKYSNKAVVPGKSPLVLVGPIVEDKRSYLAFADRTGKGLSLVRNLPTEKFASVWNLPVHFIVLSITKILKISFFYSQDCHELIINSICGNDKFLYSGGYDSKVKGWTNLDQEAPKALGEVVIGSCVNNICCGVNDNVYIASSDGIIRRAKFI